MKLKNFTLLLRICNSYLSHRVKNQSILLNGTSMLPRDCTLNPQVIVENTNMKVLNSSPVSAFGGLNYVIKEAIDLKINGLLNSTLPALPKQCKYNWFDIIMSYTDLTIKCRIPSFHSVYSFIVASAFTNKLLSSRNAAFINQIGIIGRCFFAGAIVPKIWPLT